MNAISTSASQSRRPNRSGLFSLAVLFSTAILLLGAGGCQGLNDDPNGGGLAVRFGFADSAGTASTADASTAPSNSPQISSPAGTQVLSVVVGAIVITHDKDGDGIIKPYGQADIVGLNERQRGLLETDIEQSVVFMEIVQLPTAADYVTFPIPPDNAGKWQLIAVGMRHRIQTLGEIQSNSPIYYGFIDQFLNNQIGPGGLISTPLTMEAGCGLADPPTTIPGPCL